MNVQRYRKTIETKSGKSVILRSVRRSDVEELMMYINALVEEDTFISAVKKVNRKEEEEYVEKRLKAVKEKSGFNIVAEYKGRIISNGEVSIVGGREEHVGVLGISVSKGFRNEGLGAIVVGELLRLAKKFLKLKLVYLTVFENNERAIYLYEKFGFRECGRIPKGVLYKGKYIDHVYLCLELKS